MVSVATQRIVGGLPGRTAAAPPMSGWRYFIAFVLPFTGLISVELVGTLFVHDLLTPLVIFALLIGSRTQTSIRPLRTAMLLLAVWLFGAILTDLIRQSTFEDYSRGWSRIVFLGLNMIMLWLLSKGRIGVLAVYMGASGIQMALFTLVSDQDTVRGEPWKFGIGAGLAFLVAALDVWPPLRAFLTRYFMVGAISLLAAISLYYNARSVFAIFALTGAYLALAAMAASNPRIAQRITPIGFTLLASGGLVATQILTSIYAYFASSGILGQAALRKYLDQSQADVGILLSARPESLVSLRAIMDSPFIGHGSWAKDPYYSMMFVERLREVGLYADVRYIQTTNALIPAHSHLFQAWVEAGIFGAPFWLWAAAIAIMGLFYSLKSDRAPSGLVVLTAFMLLWDILFSPFGAAARFHKAAQICILISALQYLRPVVVKQVVKYVPVMRRRPGARPV